VNRAAVGSGLSFGMAPRPGHAGAAVRAALERAGIDRAGSVLLVLTPEYADDPGPSLLAAARAAGCTQVVGCTGAGVLTDEEWVLDSPGAAAMVFSGGVGLQPVAGNTLNGTVLSLCTPEGVSAQWLDRPWKRIGAVAADVAGRGAHAVWATARVAPEGRVETLIGGAQCVIAVSQGVRPLTPPFEVAAVDGFDLLRLGGQPALKVLVGSLPRAARGPGALPLHMLSGAVTFGDPETAVDDGRYRLNHIVATDHDSLSITLSDRLHEGERLFWAMRDAVASEREMGRILDQAIADDDRPPDFGFMFPCASRGPGFYGNRDRDIEAFRDRLPGVPLVGFYGNGEIGPLDNANHLFRYSTVLGLCRFNGPR
jgi:small ligand-binding sensory domain FIST